MRSDHSKFWSRADFALDLRSFIGDGFAEIIFRLETNQKRRGNTKVALETQGGVGGNAFSSGENIAETAAWDCHVPSGLGGGNGACFQFIVDEAGGGVGAEFHGISGCLRF